MGLADWVNKRKKDLEGGWNAAKRFFGGVGRAIGGAAKTVASLPGKAVGAAKQLVSSPAAQALLPPPINLASSLVKGIAGNKDARKGVSILSELANQANPAQLPQTTGELATQGIRGLGQVIPKPVENVGEGLINSLFRPKAAFSPSTSDVTKTGAVKPEVKRRAQERGAITTNDFLRGTLAPSVETAVNIVPVGRGAGALAKGLTKGEAAVQVAKSALTSAAETAPLGVPSAQSREYALTGKPASAKETAIDVGGFAAAGAAAPVLGAFGRGLRRTVLPVEQSATQAGKSVRITPDNYGDFQAGARPPGMNRDIGQQVADIVRGGQTAELTPRSVKITTQPSRVQQLAARLRGETITPPTRTEPLTPQVRVSPESAPSVSLASETQRSIPITSTSDQLTTQGADFTPQTTSDSQIPITGGTEPKVPQKASEGVTPRQRGFAGSVKSSEVPRQVKQAVSGDYLPSSSKALYEEAYQGLQQGSVKPGDIEQLVGAKQFTQEAGAKGQALAQHYVDTGDYNAAAKVFNDLAPKLTEAGQQVQTAALLNRLKPEGIQAYAIQQADKRGTKLSTEFIDELGKRAKELEKIPLGSEEHNLKSWMLVQDIAKALPKDPFLDRIVTFWKAGLLTGIKTSGGNTLSNITHGTAEVVKDIPASVIDRGLSLVTGQRSKTFTARGIPSGVKEGFRRFGQYLRTGYDERQIASKYDVPRIINNGKGIVGKAATGYENFVFRMMGGEDMPFYYAAKTRSLYDQSAVAVKNGVIKSSQRKAFVKNPSDFGKEGEDALRNAVTDASTAVFQNDTVLGEMVNKAANVDSQFGRFAVNFLAPFRRTPSSVAMQMVNYSPVGVVKSVAEAISRSGKQGLTQDIQRQLAQGIGRSVTGTGALYVGYELVKKGLMTLAYPKDPKEQRLWELEGKQPYSILINGRWRSLNYVSPLGQLLAAGGFYKQSLDETGSPTAAALAAFAGAGKAVTEQTFLKGVSGALQALNYPQQFGERFLEQTVGSVIPTIIRDIAAGIDPLGGREVNTPGESVKSAIPIVRQSLQPRLNIFGEPIPKSRSLIEQVVDPTRPSTALNDPLAEVLRQTAKSDEGTYVPSKVDKSPGKIGGVKGVTLNPQQLQQLRGETGQLFKSLLSQATNTTGFAELDPNLKRKVIQAASEDARAISRLSASEKMKIGNPDVAFDDLTTRQKKLVVGQKPDYVASVTENKAQSDFEDKYKPKISKTVEIQFGEYLSLPAKSQQRRDYLASHGDLQGYFDAKDNYLIAYKSKFGELPFGEKEPFGKRSYGKGGYRRYARRGGRSRGGRGGSGAKITIGSPDVAEGIPVLPSTSGVSRQTSYIPITSAIPRTQPRKRVPLQTRKQKTIKIRKGVYA